MQKPRRYKRINYQIQKQKLINAFKYLKYANTVVKYFKEQTYLKLNSNIFLRRIIHFESLQEEFTIEGDKEILNREARKREE